jgi:hypothetical protein
MRVRALAFVLLAALSFAAPASAHDIPIEAMVRMFVKPQGHTLRVLVRMPLRSITDAEYPRKERDFVDLARVDPFLRDAAKVALLESLEVYEGDRKLPAPRIVSTRMSLDADQSFINYDAALAHVTGPALPVTETLYWEQGLLDVLFEYQVQSDRSYFSIHAAFDRLAQHEVTTVQFIPPDGPSRAYELPGDSGLVRLEPNWYHAAARFVMMGFHHILDGIDHLLFVLCLIIPFRRIRPLVAIVTAFTVAHSITLISAAYHYGPDALWFPPLIETLIAASIFYMALENIVVTSPRRRWIVTFCFGLVHGFGFSFGLQNTLQFAGSHLFISLLSFNIGIELGQLLVLALCVPLLNFVFRRIVAERMGVIILSAIIAHQAWHWMIERLGVLQQFPWPAFTLADAVSGLRWLFLAVAIAAVLWGISLAARRWMEPAAQEGL